MVQQEEIVLWIDQRWKNAIEKHLNDETLQEHLENVLDELCNRLPEREYDRISRAIHSEAAAQRAEEEAARTYAAYHVTERGQNFGGLMPQTKFRAPQQFKSRSRRSAKYL